MTLPGDVAFVRAHGSPYQIGYVHGASRRESLHRFLADGLCRLDRLLVAPMTLGDLRPLLHTYAAALEAATPDLVEEIAGLARGAGITVEQALLLQLRREIIGYQRIPTSGDCTSYARSGGAAGEPILAQTVDLSGNLDDQIAVLEIGHAGSGRHALVLSFGGLLGYLGVNSSGLAVGLNLVLGGTWRPGVPPYLAIRHILDRAGCVEEAIRLLAGLPLASSRSILLCDAGGAAYVEVLGDAQRVTSGEAVEHTNHFLHPALVPHDELNVFARNSSRRRLEACRVALAALPPSAGVEEHFALLCQAPIRVPDLGDIRLERTVAAVVMRPACRELHLRAGDPAAAPTRRFALS
jgi:isopenicillin-N N-acyltransferase like protein